MKEALIRTKIKEIGESLRLVEENLPDTFVEFSRLGLVKDGIYKWVEFCNQFIKWAADFIRGICEWA